MAASLRTMLMLHDQGKNVASLLPSRLLLTVYSLSNLELADLESVLNMERLAFNFLSRVPSSKIEV